MGNKITIKTVGKPVAFLLIGLFLFSFIQTVFLEKSSYGKWRNWNVQENVDILVLGNSHADNGISPLLMEERFRQAYGQEVSVFNYALYGMRTEQMYFFCNEILKTHTPKLIILETYAFCPLADEHREILARRAFDTLPLSFNKMEGIRYCILEDPWSYYVPFIKYHTRWKEISPRDISLLYDKNLWDMAGKGDASQSSEACPDPGDGWFLQDTSRIQECREITTTEKECLEKLLLLLEEKGVSLLFVSVPYKVQMGLDSIEMIKINNYLQKNYVDGDRIRLLDMNRLWRELDFDYKDLYNEGHVNQAGGRKVTNCLLQYLETNYDIDSITN